ncbi:MAG TPA: polysaccharide biosynthesis/export family protein [Terriglobales bacterium]
MTHARASWHKKLAVVAICALLSPSSPAQTASGAGTPGKAVAATPAGDTPTGKPHDDTFVIGNDDVLAISVWKEPDISRSVPVRSDGKISLPLAGEMQAAGKTPLQLERDLSAKLKDYVAEPEVTVIVQEIRSQKFNILGQVVRPGSYSLTQAGTVLDAIALAGGFRDFAKQKSIYILRQNPGGAEARLPFNYKDIIKGKDPAQNVKLQAHDTIVVP